MGMVVRTNSMAINANRQLGMNQSQVSKSLEKLSSGFKINRAADDASGLAISEKMKAQIKGLDQAASNSQDGISLIQTAEGATTEIHDMLNRMVELATKSANGTIKNEVDREAIQREVDDLNSEITRIAKSTNFNGINLLDGSLGGVSIKNNPVGNGGAVNPPAGPTQPVAGNIVTGDATTPAGFTLSLPMETDTDLTIGGSVFRFSGALPAAEGGSIISGGTGATDDPYTVNLGNAADKKAVADAIASKLNEGNTGVTVAGQKFKAEGQADGSLKFTAVDESFEAKNGEVAGLTADALKNVAKSEKVEQGGGENPTPPTGAISSADNVSAGNTATNEKAVYEFATGPSDGDTFSIGGKTYTFKTTAAAADDIELDATGADADAKAIKDFEALAGKLSGYTASVTKDAESGNFVMTLTATAAGDQTDLGDFTLKDSSTVSPTITQGKDAKAGSVDYTIDYSALKEGDVINVNGKKILFTQNSAAKGDNDAVIDFKDTPITADNFVSALNTALGTASAGYGATKASADDTKVTVTFTETTPSDASDAEKLGGLVTLTAAAAPASANPGVPATPGAPANYGIATAKAGDVLGGNDAKGSATITMTSQPKKNSTITVGEGNNAVTFEFVENVGDTLKNAGATAVVIGADTKTTMNNLKTALDGAGIADVTIAQDADTGAITITNDVADVDANDAAPTVKTAGGGLGLQVGDTNEDFNKVTVSVDDLSAAGIGTAGLDVSNQDAAGNAIDIIKAAINKVSTNRANLGSLQNRLEHTINNLNVTSENMTAANSAIRDTDMAKEMMNYTKMNVLTQAAQAMLAQANQQPQAILQLLQ